MAGTDALEDAQSRRFTKTKRASDYGSDETYTLSDVGRLLEVDRTGTNSYNRTFTYDPNGNRATKSEGGTTWTYTYNAANWMLEVDDGTNTTDFAHDDNGNVTGEGTSLDYTYNGNNRLVEVDSGSTVNTYVYDGRNRRVEADDGTVEKTYYYSALGMSLEQEDGVDHAAYVRLPGGQQMAIFGPDGDFYYLYDGSGNIIGIIDVTSLPGSSGSTPPLRQRCGEDTRSEAAHINYS